MPDPLTVIEELRSEDVGGWGQAWNAALDAVKERLGSQSGVTDAEVEAADSEAARLIGARLLHADQVMEAFKAGFAAHYEDASDEEVRGEFIAWVEEALHE
jgi:hypothetical protein